jgi:hypothetical protein
MRRDGVPITRENYLQMAYFGEVPQPWSAEDEAGLPKELQDWSGFKVSGRAKQ